MISHLDALRLQGHGIECERGDFRFNKKLSNSPKQISTLDRHCSPYWKSAGLPLTYSRHIFSNAHLLYFLLPFNITSLFDYGIQQLRFELRSRGSTARCFTVSLLLAKSGPGGIWTLGSRVSPWIKFGLIDGLIY